MRNLSSRRDLALALDMVLAARDAQAFVTDMDAAGFAASRLHQNATIRCLEVIGEAAGRISQEFRAAYPDIPWRKMTGMRNRLIHEYGDVRIDVVWRVVREELPQLVAMLAPLLPPEA